MTTTEWYLLTAGLGAVVAMLGGIMLAAWIIGKAVTLCAKGIQTITGGP